MGEGRGVIDNHVLFMFYWWVVRMGVVGGPLRFGCLRVGLLDALEGLLGLGSRGGLLARL